MSALTGLLFATPDFAYAYRMKEGSAAATVTIAAEIQNARIYSRESSSMSATQTLAYRWADKMVRMTGGERGSGKDVLSVHSYTHESK